MTKSNAMVNGNGNEVVKYNSISAEVKALIIEKLADGKEYDRKVIVSYVREHAQNKETLTDGIIAGGFKMLTATGEIKAIGRAVYQKGTKLDDLTFREKVMAAYERFQQDLNKICTMNLLYATKEDLDSIKAISELNNLIESELWKIEDTGKEDTDDTLEEKGNLLDSKKEAEAAVV